MTHHSIILIFLCFTLNFSQQIHPKLQPFSHYIGKTFVGEFPNSTPEKPQIDVQSWELILNGQAIRIMHSVNDGAYGGESILTYNTKKDKVEFYYFTTAGFYTNGTLEINDNVYTSHEYVIGNEDGITEVKSVSTLRESGEIHVHSTFFKNGKWIDDSNSDIIYKPSKTAKVKFK